MKNIFTYFRPTAKPQSGRFGTERTRTICRVGNHSTFHAENTMCAEFATFAVRKDLHTYNNKDLHTRI